VEVILGLSILGRQVGAYWLSAIHPRELCPSLVRTEGEKADTGSTGTKKDVGAVVVTTAKNKKIFQQKDLVRKLLVVFKRRSAV